LSIHPLLPPPHIFPSPRYVSISLTTLTTALYRLVHHPYHITATTTFTKNSITTPQSLPHNPDASRLPDPTHAPHVPARHHSSLPPTHLLVRHFSPLPHNHFVCDATLSRILSPSTTLFFHCERLICYCIFFFDRDNVP